MSASVTVSATTAVYNQQDTIAQTIESVVALGDLLEEYILLDDCSTDGTFKILEDYAARYPVIKLLKNDHNRGAVYSFKRVFFEAQGTYVLGVAGDDYFLPDGLRQLIEFARKNPGFGLYCGDIDIRYEDENRIFHDHFGFSPESAILPAAAVGAAVQGKYIPSAGMLIKRELIIGDSAYREELRWIADWFANLDIGFKHGMGYCPAATVVLRYYDSNFSSQHSDWKKQRPVLMHLMYLLQSREYADIYPGLVKYRMLNALQGGVPRLLLTHPSLWDRHTVKIIGDTTWHLLRQKIAALLPARWKNVLKKLLRSR